MDEVLEVAAGNGDVGKDMLAGLTLGAAQQAYSLEVAGYVGRAHGGGHTLVPTVAQGRVEGLDAAAELDGEYEAL